MSTQPLVEVTHAEVTRSLQEALDAASWDLKHWTAVLPFTIRNTMGNVVFEESRHEKLLEYLKPMYKGHKIYFGAKYDSKHRHFGPDNDEGWKNLLKDIEVVVIPGGFYPISNGGDRSKRVIICRGSRMYQGTKQQLHSPSKQHYRIETLHSDRKNSRGKAGKLLP